MPLPSASNSLTVRIKYQNKVGNLAKLAQAIADAGGSVGSMDVVESDSKLMVRDIVIDCFDTKHQNKIIETIKGLQSVEVVSVSDRTFEMHQGGKIEVTSKAPLVSRDDLSMAYTPGVARISTAVAEDPIKAFALTIRQNCVAVVSDGSAVLGLGDIGPLGAMPVMEGKAMLFKEFGKVDAFPICLSVNDPKGIIDAVKAIAPTFGGINLEDIAAPKCFEVEETLRAELDIPVFHDDQHGTAAVVLAALYNALKIVDKDISAIKVVVLGAGAAGVACSKALMGAGVRNVILCDRAGTIYKGRKEG
ncbi:MAG TPA: malic enzyme-like NAD(P)-binding protein, partial [Armatimonadota bacterium]|nr:malic enzyme-like NAD(P)-binding protein [Armatimonadota bacterium]